MTTGRINQVTIVRRGRPAGQRGAAGEILVTVGGTWTGAPWDSGLGWAVAALSG